MCMTLECTGGGCDIKDYCVGVTSGGVGMSHCMIGQSVLSPATTGCVAVSAGCPSNPKASFVSTVHVNPSC